MPIRALAPWILCWSAAALAFSIWPELDLATSAAFWNADTGFAGLRSEALLSIHRWLIDLSWAIAIGGLVWIPLTRFKPASGRYLSRGAAIFILLSLILGPGVLGKATKDGWGRARPITVTQFGGDRQFTPFWKKTDQCARNCAFFSGHAAFAFWFGAIGLALGRHRLALALSFGVGIPVALMRVAQGGHFFSDVVFAALFVMTLNELLYQLLRRRLALGPAV